MKTTKVLIVVLCIAQLSGCATFWNDMNRAYDRTHRQDDGQQQTRPTFTPDPLPNYYPTYGPVPVVQPQLSDPSGSYICNTIGYVTTCQEE